MLVRDYHLLREADIERCRLSTLNAIQCWEAEWGELSLHEIDCISAEDTSWNGELARLEWSRCQVEKDICMWVCTPSGVDRILERILFAVGDGSAGREKYAESTIASDVAYQGLSALTKTILDSFFEQKSFSVSKEDSDLSALFAKGAGTVLVTLSLETKRIRFLVPFSLLKAGRRVQSGNGAKGITDLVTAAKGLSVKVFVEVGRAEVSIGHLNGLTLGDVISLSARVDEPIRVTDTTGVAIAYGQLGFANGKRAVELVNANGKI